MVQEEALDGAVEHDDPDMLIRFDGRHDVPEFTDELRTHHIERRIIECDSPVRGRQTSEVDLRGLGRRHHENLLMRRLHARRIDNESWRAMALALVAVVTRIVARVYVLDAE